MSSPSKYKKSYYSTLYESKTGNIKYLDKSKKHKWKWGKEVENIEKTDNNSKKLLAKSKNLGIIYNKDLIRNYDFIQSVPLYD